MKFIYALFFVLTAFIFPSFCDTLIENQQLDYLIYLPDNWVRLQKSDTQDVFYDSTKVYKSRISIVSYTMDKNVYDSSEEWTRAHFIAYKTFIDLESYPFGTVLYSDSAKSVVQDSHWSCELYARFFSFDSVMYSWDEYVRYSATPTRGYEIYALGDTTDMKTNIGLYGAIMQAIEIGGITTNVAAQKPFRDANSNAVLSVLKQDRSGKACYSVDMRGRIVSRSVPVATVGMVSISGEKAFKHFYFNQ